jgi:HEAT repeat protein
VKTVAFLLLTGLAAAAERPLDGDQLIRDGSDQALRTLVEEANRHWFDPEVYNGPGPLWMVKLGPRLAPFLVRAWPPGGAPAEVRRFAYLRKDARALAERDTGAADPLVAEEAARALGRYPNTLPLLLALLKDPRPLVRAGAIQGLALLDDKRAQPELEHVLVEPDAPAPSLPLLQHLEEWDARAFRTETLHQAAKLALTMILDQGVPLDSDFALGPREAIDGGDEATRDRAAEELLRDGSDEALARLVDAAEDHYFDVVPYNGQGLHWLRKMRAKLGGVLLRRFQGGHMPYHVMMFAQGECVPDIEPVLVREIREADDEAARLAAMGLGGCKTPSALRLLQKIVRSDTRPLVRHGALRGLHSLHDRRAIPALEDSLLWPEETVYQVEPRENPPAFTPRVSLHDRAREILKSWRGSSRSSSRSRPPASRTP